MGECNLDKRELEKNGYLVKNNIFDREETARLLKLVTFPEKTYATRQLISKRPEILSIMLENKKFRYYFQNICTTNYFLTKAIYFNKLAGSNWFVNFHQDLSISVQKKMRQEGYKYWTEKKGQLGVIPPIEILENMVTFRIHLDETNHENGALRVLPGSHSSGIIRIDDSFNKKYYGKEEICDVESGGMMIMKPLLLHASSKSISMEDRRVIHLEFSNQEIPMGWLEKKKVV